ncbi:MAG: DUF1552 domain-containing protein [Polyangiaceae bacterium]|nr:DUF1552 domain-containing protein [Polyangiaceae bacterium]
MSSQHQLKRRTFLTALGLGIAAPLASKMAHLAVAAPTGAPVRLLNLYIPHGVPWEFADPALENGQLDLLAKGDSGIFAPLAPYASHVNMMRGFAMAAQQFNHDAIDTMWTGSKGGSSDSFDYLIAQKLGVKAHTLGAIPYSEFEGYNRDSYLLRHGGQWVIPELNPAVAADELFSAFSTPSNGVDESAFRVEAMDLTSRQIERLAQKARGLSSEESKLSQHLSALLNLKEDQSSRTQSCSERPSMPLVEAARTINPLDETQFGKIFDAHLEAAGHAMVCGSAQVLSLHALWVNSNLLFNFEDGPGIALGHHMGLSHGPRGQFALAQRWFMDRLAQVLLPILDRDDPAAPGSTVLDNSIIYISSEVSDGNNHNSDAGETYVAGSPTGTLYTCLPQMLIGGGAGYLKSGGNVINVEQNREHTDVMATIADAMGAPLSTIGDGSTNIVTEAKA